MFAAAILSAVLVIFTAYLHFWALKLSAQMAIRGNFGQRRPLLYIIGIVFAAHLAAVLVYAGAYFLLETIFGAGAIAGAGETDRFRDLFYFSIASYTTLGIGDLVPEGAMRIVAGIEALNGLLLIAWSASFSYFAMERLWAPDEPAPGD